jgi:ABC-type multidrug transport system permease subunit
MFIDWLVAAINYLATLNWPNLIVKTVFLIGASIFVTYAVIFFSTSKPDVQQLQSQR